jgi:hypothetical protein
MNFHHATEVALLMKQHAWLDGFQSRDTERIKLLTERGCIKCARASSTKQFSDFVLSAIGADFNRRQQNASLLLTNCKYY